MRGRNTMNTTDRVTGYVLDRHNNRVEIATISPRDAAPGDPYSVTCWCGWGAEDTSQDHAKTALEDHRKDPQADDGHNDKRPVWWV
jgi:hypothetical protein